jgi:hypothetical protein
MRKDVQGCTSVVPNFRWRRLLCVCVALPALEHYAAPTLCAKKIAFGEIVLDVQKDHFYWS